MSERTPGIVRAAANDFAPMLGEYEEAMFEPCFKKEEKSLSIIIPRASYWRRAERNRCRRAFRKHSGVANGAAPLYLRDQLRRNLTANGVRDCIHEAEFINRFIVINREHVRDTERAGVIQLLPANTCAPIFFAV